MVRLSLAQRIVAITAAALLPILGVLVYNEAALRQNRGTEIRALAIATAEQAAREMERLTSGADGILHAMAAAPVVQRFDIEGCSNFLVHLAPALPQFTRISILDLEGTVVCGSDPTAQGLDLSDRPYFTEALANGGRLVVGEYTVSRVTGDKVLPLALAILGADGQPRGVVATSMDLDWLGATLRERQLARNGSLTIADRNGVIIAREPFPERFVGTAIPEAFQPLVRAGAPGSIEVTSQDGTQRILGYIPAGLSPVGLYISTGIAREEAFGPFDAAARRTLALVLAAVIVAGGLSWFLGQRLVRGPVSQIASALAARRAGDEAIRTNMCSRDGEIEALGATFDSYMDELNTSREERDRAEAALRATAAEKERLADRNELLAREMSHRVMNSFQLMESIFALQTRRVADPLARRIITEAEERIRSMALVHRQLFQITRDEMQELDAAAYLGGLTRDLVLAFVKGDAVRIEVDAEAGVALSPGQGIALGLLVTELVLNAIKHAFKARDQGTIRIVLGAASSSQLRLIVEDDGTGLPAAEARATATGVGMKLLDGFLRQLEGTLTVEGPPGTRFVVLFPISVQAGPRTEPEAPLIGAV
ncbi:HAMP domain-containing protein [Rubellimicrobium rubrum]|uniref:histidine kinase n=1 Tax=Rubellimicrobium rubrum TaxID=2585369 RepID=A0A5C4N499_9RHOB|nr:cache domain-containing protein [Rubellimicrobium rubrum]TNC51667.1 HAMP domain-containing protein [Rubellimicrobium rubrum]